VSANPKLPLSREQLVRLLDGQAVQVPTSVGLFEVEVSGPSSWQPLRQGVVNPALIEAYRAHGQPLPVAVWANDLYDVVVNQDGEITHLSIKRHDRAPVRNWRHLQQIKNEVCGPDREAVELFPAEERLADNANQYHLWVLPSATRFPLGFPEGLVLSDDEVEKFNADPRHSGRQEPWQPGLTTGAHRNQGGAG
jgi:hypothetical protein